MTIDQGKILAVPTNIITGFLGVGKSSAIMQLLKHKPADERWAVLVNEFGEIGVDGSLFEGQSEINKDVFIQEVPGGCMCCASGLPMQIALNLLLSKARPDRLLIEPTGLGHPIEVLQLLSNQYYCEVLSLEKTIALVDARNLADKRYTEHETFNQQIAIADIVVGNKTDLYSNLDKRALADYLSVKNYPKENLFFTTHGKLAFSWLAGATDYRPDKHQLLTTKRASVNNVPIPDIGFIKATNKGEGFNSIGWRFAPEKVFSRAKLKPFLLSIDTYRLKAVFITTEGVYGYNKTVDGLNEVELDDCLDSRIEIICDQIDDNWQLALEQAIV